MSSKFVPSSLSCAVIANKQLHWNPNIRGVAAEKPRTRLLYLTELCRLYIVMTRAQTSWVIMETIKREPTRLRDNDTALDTHIRLLAVLVHVHPVRSLAPPSCICARCAPSRSAVLAPPEGSSTRGFFCWFPKPLRLTWDSSWASHSLFPSSLCYHHRRPMIRFSCTPHISHLVSHISLLPIAAVSIVLNHGNQLQKKDF